MISLAAVHLLMILSGNCYEGAVLFHFRADHKRTMPVGYEDVKRQRNT